eukprot:2993941-Rhodomonas_salina.2
MALAKSNPKRGFAENSNEISVFRNVALFARARKRMAMRVSMQGTCGVLGRVSISWAEAMDSFDMFVGQKGGVEGCCALVMLSAWVCPEKQRKGRRRAASRPHEKPAR